MKKNHNKSNINIQLGDTIGVSRKLDTFGRVVLPVEFRKELELIQEEEPWVEIFLVNGGIYIRKKKFLYKGEKDARNLERY